MESRRNGPQLSSRHDDDDDDKTKIVVSKIHLRYCCPAAAALWQLTHIPLQ